jgi:uncharacterized membrane protein YhaH (DUF805 family)
MLKVYFGEWGSGKLQRLAYLGYHLLLMFIVIAVIFATIFAVGATENFIGGDFMATQAMLGEHFGFVAVFGIVVLMMGMFLGQINIMAKRIRDIGLPAAWTILGIVVVSMMLNILFPAQIVEIGTAVIHTSEGTAAAAAATQTVTSPVVQLFDTVVFLCLLFIPSDAFRKNS